MWPSLAALTVGLFETYVGIGALFALPFVTWGVDRIDPQAQGAPWGFRLLILPGALLLWPLLLMRWASGSMAPPPPITAHTRAARGAPR